MSGNATPKIVWDSPAAAPTPTPKIVWNSPASPAAPTPSEPQIQWDNDSAPTLLKRAGIAGEYGALEGGSDLAGTLGMGEAALGNYLIPGSEPEGGAIFGPVAKQLRSMEPAALPPAKTKAGAITDVVAGAGGELAPAVAEWFAGVPFAVAHGIHTAQEQAAAQGKTATVYQEAHDAVTEGLMRGLLGKVAALPIGRVTKSLIFGGGSGYQSQLEGADTKTTWTNVAVNTLLGLIVPDLDFAEKRAAQKAADAAARGDGKGAMTYLKPILEKHSTSIAAAARQVTERVQGESEDEHTVSSPSTTPRIAAVESEPEKPKTKTPRSEPGTALTVPGKAVGPAKPPGPGAGKPFGEGDQFTPLEKAVTEKRVGADMAVRITQREYTDALARKRMSDLETAFHGMPDDQRIGMMTAYQQGGIEAIPDTYKPVFHAVQSLMEDLYHSADNLGVEYEYRKNYLPGMWRDKTKAQSWIDRILGANSGGPGPGAGKGFFTKEKVFNDYLEGVRAGLQPKSTNVATVAAWRAEAQSRALAKILSMRDLMEDGRAYLMGDLTEQGVQWNPGSPFGPIPKELAGGKVMDVGGKRYIVDPAAAKMFEWGYQLDKVDLAKLIGADEDGKLVRLAGTLGKSWMTLRNLYIPFKLSLSGFHALHVLTIDMVQPVSAALTESLNGRLSFTGFLKAMADQDMRGSFAYGRHLGEIFERPYDALNDNDRMLVNIMIAGGFNPLAPGIYEVRANEMIRRSLNDEIPTLVQQYKVGQIDRTAAAMGVTAEWFKANILGRLGAVAESVQGPLFRDWIPAIKAAAFMNQASLFLSTHPELLVNTKEANMRLRIGLRDITKSIDNRFGMMQMDKLFMPNALKRALMGTFLSVGWNLGFLREFVWGPGTSEGAIPDSIKMIRDMTPGLKKPGVKAELTHRVVYAFSYVLGSMLLIGISNYLSTGKGPDDPNYFVYLRLPDGTKLNTMFFTREFAAFYYHIKQQGLFEGAWDWVEAKQAPMVESMIEAINNRDFYGDQVYDINAPLPEQIAQIMEHMWVGTTVPISLQANTEGPGQTPSQMALALAGFTKAPGYVMDSGPVGQIQQAYKATHNGDVTAYGDVARHTLLHQARMYYQQYLKNRDPDAYAEFASTLSQYEHLYPYSLGRGGADIKREIKSWAEPQGAVQFGQLDAETQTRLLREWNAADQATYLRYAHPSVRHLFAQTSPAIVWQTGPAP